MLPARESSRSPGEGRACLGTDHYIKTALQVKFRTGYICLSHAQVTLLRAKAADYDTQVGSLQAKTTELENTVAELHGLLAQPGDAGLSAQYQEARRMVSALQQDIYFLREKEAEVRL